MLEKVMELHILLYLMAVLGTAGAVGMLAEHLAYRRAMRKTKAAVNLKEKWLNLWRTRDRLLGRMNLLVWLPSLLAVGCLGLALFFNSRTEQSAGLPLQYLYVGTAVPIVLLLLRQALDFTYREELVMNSLADYIQQAKTRNEDPPAARKFTPAASSRKTDPALREEMVEHITASHPADCGHGKPFQQDAQSRGRRDHAGDHTGIYGLIKYKNRDCLK